MSGDKNETPAATGVCKCSGICRTYHFKDTDISKESQDKNRFESTLRRWASKNGGAS